MLLKVLPNLQDQLEFSYPNHKGEREDNHNNIVNNVNDRIKAKQG